MSKTVEQQIEKSRNLVEGLRKHLNGIGGGVTNDEIGQMEQSLKELEVHPEGEANERGAGPCKRGLR